MVPLRRGVTVVGRGAGCSIVVPSEKASRNHARFLVNGEGVFLEDLNSTNGVFVNSMQIRGQVRVAVGDRILIGDALLKIVDFEDLKRTHRSEEMPTELTDTIIENGPETPLADDGPTRQVHAFEILAGLVDKVLALGRADEAVRLLKGPIERIVRDAERGVTVELSLSAASARHSLRLAVALNDPYWIDLMFRTHRALARLLPLSVVDELYGALRTVRGVNKSGFRDYLEQLRATTRSLSPADRFTLNRLEGLSQLI